MGTVAYSQGNHVLDSGGTSEAGKAADRLDVPGTCVVGTWPKARHQKVRNLVQGKASGCRAFRRLAPERLTFGEQVAVHLAATEIGQGVVTMAAIG